MARLVFDAPYFLPTFDAEEDRSWRLRAACRDQPTDLFFAERGQTEKVEAARAICATCPVRTECLEFSLSTWYTRSLGIWGGTTPRQRRGLEGRGNDRRSA